MLRDTDCPYVVRLTHLTVVHLSKYLPTRTVVLDRSIKIGSMSVSPPLKTIGLSRYRVIYTVGLCRFVHMILVLLVLLVLSPVPSRGEHM